METAEVDPIKERELIVTDLGIAQAIAKKLPDFGREIDDKTVLLTRPGIEMHKVIKRLFPLLPEKPLDLSAYKLSETMLADQISSGVGQVLDIFSQVYPDKEKNYHQESPTSDREQLGIALAVTAKLMKTQATDEQILNNPDFVKSVEIFNSLYQTDFPQFNLGTAFKTIMGDLRNFESVRRRSEQSSFLGEQKEYRRHGSFSDAVRAYIFDSPHLAHVIGPVGPESSRDYWPERKIILPPNENKWQEEFDRLYPPAGNIPPEWKFKLVNLRHGVGKNAQLDYEEAKKYLEVQGWTVEALDFPDFGTPDENGNPYDFQKMSDEQMAKLRVKYGDDFQCIIWGRSLGGLVTAQTVTGPDAGHVLGVVYDCVPMAGGEASVLPQLMWLVDFIKAHPDQAKPVLRRLGILTKNEDLKFLATNPRMLFSVYQTHMRTDYYDELKDQSSFIETVSINGAADYILFYSGCDAASRLPGADQLYVPGMGHGFKDPEKMHRILYKMAANINDPARRITVEQS